MRDRCEGSGGKPGDVHAVSSGLVGRCPICRRWIMLSKRTEVLLVHQFRPAEPFGEPVHLPPPRQ
jgi:hypothetical protein